jgi:hypothetical protein
MSRQAVMATLKAAGGSSGTGPGIRYIGSSIPSNGSRVYANGSNSASGSILIDKIAEISSTSTKYTTIECTATYGVDPPRSMSGNRSSKSKDESMLIISNFSLFIDWDHPGGGKMVFQGRYTFPGGSDDRHTGWQFYNGEYSIEAAGGSITMSPTSDHMGRGPRSSGGPILKYNANRQVTGVPVIDGPTHLVGSCALHSYTITTDTGVVVTATPTPPAETPTAPVVGIKISELTPVSALQDDDLFVLSQDDASDGTYEASLNVTLANLKAGIEPPPILQTVAWANFNGKQKPDGSAIGATGPCKIEGSSTVASVEKVTTGQYQITLSQTMADHNYCVVATCGRQLTSESSAGAICFVEVDGKEVDNFTLSTRLINTGGTRVDMSYMGFVVMGELQA